MTRVCEFVRSVCVVLFVLLLHGHCAMQENNWIVLLDSSKYWFNYRHMVNSLALYKEFRRIGIPDDRIIYMNALEAQCDLRNPYPGQVFNERKVLANGSNSLFDHTVQIDYVGDDVTHVNFMRLLTGRHLPGTPHSKRLDTNEASNIIIFMTGHGGDGFFKFQDFEEITAEDIAHAVLEMHIKQRFKRILFLVDTCQASTLTSQITVPGVATISSSDKDQNSYAYITNEEVGLSVMDRFSYSLWAYLRKLNPSNLSARIAQPTIADLFKVFRPGFLRSTPVIMVSPGTQDPSNIPLAPFLYTRAHRSQKSTLVSAFQDEDISWEGLGTSHDDCFSSYSSSANAESIGAIDEFGGECNTSFEDSSITGLLLFTTTPKSATSSLLHEILKLVNIAPVLICSIVLYHAIRNIQCIYY